jgi:SNF2 family DNA or RNA helicase
MAGQVAELSDNCVTAKWYGFPLSFKSSMLISPSAVFSFWTSTLDLVQRILDVNDITYTRIDGKTSLVKRAECMRLFQTDDTVRVILVSITCGGAG